MAWMGCLLMQAASYAVAQEPITWRWDYSEADDAFIDLVDEASSGFRETNTPDHYAGRLVVELGEELSFKSSEVPTLLFDSEAEAAEFRVESCGERRVELSLSTPHRGSKRSDPVRVRLNPKAIKGPLKKEYPTEYQIEFHASGVPAVFVSPVTGRSYSLVSNDEFNDAVIDTLKWDTRSRLSPFTRRGMYREAPYYVLCHDEWTREQNGELRLEVSKYPTQPSVVMTGGILSQGRFMTRYGYYETKVSFRDCRGEGYWPAFWLMFTGEDMYDAGTEIDIFEYIPRDRQIFQTLHWYQQEPAAADDKQVQHAAKNYDKTATVSKHRSSTKFFPLERAEEEPHTFAVEWTPDELIFYTDGEVTRRVDRSNNPREVPAAYQMVYFSCSAGEWGGNVMNNQEPAYVYFDYCRCYQAEDQDAVYTLHGESRKIPARERQGKL